MLTRVICNDFSESRSLYSDKIWTPGVIPTLEQFIHPQYNIKKGGATGASYSHRTYSLQYICWIKYSILPTTEDSAATAQAGGAQNSSPAIPGVEIQPSFLSFPPITTCTSRESHAVVRYSPAHAQWVQILPNKWRSLLTYLWRSFVKEGNGRHLT